MHTSRRNFIRAGAVTLPGMLLLDGCKSSNSLPPPPAPALLITALDVAEVAVSAALPFVGTLDPAWGTYLKAIASVCSNAVSVLDNASLTQAQQYGQIAIAIAQVVAPALPGGGGEVVVIVEAVIGAVQAIIAIVGTPKASVSLKASITLSAGAREKLKTYQSQVKALGSDKARIADIAARAGQMNGH